MPLFGHNGGKKMKIKQTIKITDFKSKEELNNIIKLLIENFNITN